MFSMRHEPALHEQKYVRRQMTGGYSKDPSDWKFSTKECSARMQTTLYRCLHRMHAAFRHLHQRTLLSYGFCWLRKK